MAKPSNTAKAIQLDEQAWRLRCEAYKIDRTYSNPNTCAETHVAKIAERVMAQSEFIKSIADHFGKKSMDE